MHRLTRTAALLAALLMLAAQALADPLALDGSYSGTEYWPEGTDAESATYVYTYAYPKLAEDSETAGTINETYRYLIDDAIAFTVPINGGMFADAGAQCRTDIVSEVTCNSDEWFSVLTTTSNDQGDGPVDVLTARTFARNGAFAGQAVSLPRYMGILDDSETDEWMLDRQASKANNLVWELIWAWLEDESGATLYPDMTYEDFQTVFFPEDDYYLDENGDPVFFIQAGCVTDISEGVLLWRITLEDLKDEL